MTSSGIGALSNEQGLELFDAARAVDESLLVPVKLDIAALRAQARSGMLPAMMRGLVRSPARRAGDAQGSLARALAAAPESEWQAITLELVLGHVAAVLGHASGEAIDPGRAFKELGFDSLGAVELRNRLSLATGVRLTSTVIFDHPTPVAVAELLRSRIEGSERGLVVSPRAAHTDEPIAIIGMSCRYPGGVGSPEDLWELVAHDRDVIGELPADRGWDLEALYDPDPDHAGTSYTRHGGFLYDAGEFDAAFFGIAPREALAMDPQQRLLLEGAWEAFEDAGIDPQALRGSQTGVFAGVSYSDYCSGAGSPDELEGFLLTGGAMSVVSGRLSYTFGLEGPAVTVDTACSSSLVALHLACGALRSGECSLALAGGVTVLSTPAVLVAFSRQRGLSSDGRCKSFADGADGTGWSEGAGLLLLERLSDARRNGHEVLAVVRSSATNQDGASNGLTAPNGPSQQRVIAQALANARLSASQVDAVEAHGTGTTLGDPIEAQALLATYGQARERPLWLGSVKSNIGHTQAAAGVAGVIKMVMAMRHGALPKSLHIDEPTAQVDWSAGAVSLLREQVPWPEEEHPRRAGVSSFGMSGTNAHVILEEAPHVQESPRAAEEGSNSFSSRAELPPFVISASSEPALRAQAERLGAHLRARSQLDLHEVATTLALHRASLEHRAVVSVRDREALLVSLKALEHGEQADGLMHGVARHGAKVAFMFPGQGSQWAGMGQELYEAFPVFAEQMQACAEALCPYVDFSLEDVLRGVDGAPTLERVDVVQPALFAVMVSLARLWRSLGVKPSVVVGHSQGEIAAAYVAGGLSLEDAARVVALRSRALADELAGRGGMMSVSLFPQGVGQLLEPFGKQVSLAAVNGPSSVVLSGAPQALEELLSQCEAQGTRARMIPVDYASHSVLVEEIRERLLRELDPIQARSGEIPFYSTATGTLLDTSGSVASTGIAACARLCASIRPPAR